MYPRLVGFFVYPVQVHTTPPLRPPPYCPQRNSKAERMVRTVTEALRAMMIGVDPRLWCYALETFSIIWNRVHAQRSTVKTPEEQVEHHLIPELDPRRQASTGNESGQLFRKLGPLAVCYAEDPVRRGALEASGLATGKFAPKWIPGVYLGKGPQSSNPLLGIWIDGNFKQRRVLF